MKLLFTISILSLALNSCNNTNNQQDKETVNSTSTDVETNTPKTANNVINYLNAENEISFSGTAYKLAWSAFDGKNYYKQEYIPENNTLEKYNEMIFIDFIKGNLTAKSIVEQKVEEIKERKKTDALANYQLSYNDEKKEFLLDFILSQGDNNNQVSIVEWNVYRIKDDDGNTGPLLYALSKRGYGKKSLDFMNDLKENRLKYITEFALLPMPTITLNK